MSCIDVTGVTVAHCPRRAAPWMTTVGLALLALLAGCASVDDRNPVPAALADAVQILGRTDLRVHTDESADILLKRFEDRRHADGQPESRPVLPVMLALSGGAEDGAFGAGLLVGWTAAGNRPEFSLVSGVSAGALIAPFAFLGPAWDGQLKAAFTELNPDEVFAGRPLTSLFGASSVAEFRLETVVARFFDEPFLAAVADAYASGRTLLVVTADLDSQRGQVWNMGAIAASGHPEALALFRKVIVASASVPGLFPPVPIAVQAGGRRYEELHVDGGLATQVFAYPETLPLARLAPPGSTHPTRQLFVIRNGRLGPEREVVSATVPAIIGRALFTLTKQQSRGDLYRIYLASRRDQVNFHLAQIPRDFIDRPAEPFEQRYMRALFRLARARARAGWVWDRLPPGWVNDDE